MIRFSLLLLSSTLVFAAVACGGDDDDDGGATPAASVTAAATDEPDATSTGTPGPTATPDPVPLGVRSLINAARTGDIAAIERAVLYEPVPCTTAQGAGGPPKCAAGEAEGTPVEVVFITNCEGYYVRPGELALDQVAFGVFGNGDVLHGVYAIDETSQLARTEPWADATLAIVLNRIGPADATLPYVLIYDGRNIVGTAAGCDPGIGPEQWVADEGLGEPLLTP